jgi:hypothetical protein
MLMGPNAGAQVPVVPVMTSGGFVPNVANAVNNPDAHTRLMAAMMTRRRTIDRPMMMGSTMGVDNGQ